MDASLSNGEVEGPPRSAPSAPRAHTVFPRPPTHVSRPAPTNKREFPVPEAARAARHQSAKIEFADQSEPEKGNS
jgi:hypothetical protein